MKEKNLPIEHNNIILEKVSEQYFRNVLPIEWIVDKPIDYGIDLIVSLVNNNEVIGLNFSVQLKSKHFCRGKFNVSLKKSTLNYLFNRLEPAMLVLYDGETKKAYWKWLIKSDFDLTKNIKNYKVNFDEVQTIETIAWSSIQDYVQKIFKVQKHLLTSLEYDLLNNSNEAEVKAWAHYLTGNTSEAIFHFKRLLQKEYKAIWLLVLAQCEYSNHDYNSAIHSINLALELDKNDNILLTKGCILAEDGIKTRDFLKIKAAEKIFSYLHSESPNSINSFNYANTSYHLNEIEKSKTLFKQALKLDKNYAEAWKNLGQIYYDGEKYQKAIECYDKALQINPNLLQAIVSKGIALGVGFKKYKDAINLLNQAVKDDHYIFLKFPEVFFWFTHFYFKSGKAKDALLWVNRGLDHSPSDFNLRLEKAHIFIHFLKDNIEFLDDAIAFYAENYLINAKDPINYYYWCQALKMKSEPKIFKTKINEWFYNYIPFDRQMTEEVLERYDVSELHNCLKNWNTYANYLTLYSIDQIEIDLNELGFKPHNKIFFAEFQINRIIFLSLFTEMIQKKATQSTFKRNSGKVIENIINRFSTEALAEMIVARPADLKPFADQLAVVISSTSLIVMREFPRCTGYIVGSIYKEQIPLLDNLIDGGSLYRDIILKFTEQLYIHFGLP